MLKVQHTRIPRDIQGTIFLCFNISTYPIHTTVTLMGKGLQFSKSQYQDSPAQQLS